MAQANESATVNLAVRLFTVREAERMLSLSRSTLYNLMERGALPYVKIGRARRIRIEEIESLIQSFLISRSNPVAG